jgi:DNA-binding MarR family transcriptional regulator
MSTSNSRSSATVSVPKAEAALVNLDHYVPAYLTWIANKLSGGASQHYLNAFGVGIETWRCLVLLAAEPTVSAQQISKVIGMDKSSVSRCFKSMQEQKLITLTLSDTDGRIRLASLTTRGRKLHDQILGVALERERVLLSTLSTSEQDILVNLLTRLHENLPAVETATHVYLEQNFPGFSRAVASKKRPGPS